MDAETQEEALDSDGGSSTLKPNGKTLSNTTAVESDSELDPKK